MTNQLPELELPRYFAGQRLTAAQLNANTSTERERRWFHNRALHGTGISTGLVVTKGESDSELVVQPGHAIDPEGRDLVVTASATIQVPPVSGGITEEGQPQPERFFVVIRWPEAAEPVRGTGPCDAEGVIGMPENALVEIVREDLPNDVPLAIVEVHDCAVFSLSLSPRNVLGERRLPYVDGGVFIPTAGPAGSPGSWSLLTAGRRATAYALSVTVDTSEAGFHGVPRYQARVSGRRRGSVPDGSGDFLLWTPDAYVTDESTTSLTMAVAILSVWQIVRERDFEQGTFQQFLDEHYEHPTDFLSTITDDLGWGVTWIGVEGAI